MFGTLRGSFSAGWLAGKPDYPQKLKVPEGYEKINHNSNIGHGTADSLTANESFTRTTCTATYSAIQTAPFSAAAAAVDRIIFKN